MFRKELSSVITQEGVSYLIPTCEEIFYISEIKNELPTGCRVICESIDTLSRLHHKGNFIEWAMQLGLQVPKTYVIPTTSLPVQASHISSFFGLNSGVVVKPSYTRFSSEVIISKNGHMDENRLSSLGSSRDLIVQELVMGEQICTFTLVHSGRILAHSSYRSKHTAGLGATIHFEEAYHLASRKWIEEFVEKISFSGQIAFDFIEDSKGRVFPIECNPRLTSGVHLMSALQVKQWLAQSIDEKEDIPHLPERKRAMLGLAMIVYGLRNAFRCPTKLLRYFIDLVSTKDVVFRLQDPLPFFAQFLTFFQFLVIGWRFRISAIQASTHDICWNQSTVLHVNTDILEES